MGDNEIGLRRWQDRVTTVACALVLTLTAVVWGVTWKQTSDDVEVVEGIQRGQGERLIRIEAEVNAQREMLTEMRKDLKEIKVEVKK